MKKIFFLIPFLLLGCASTFQVIIDHPTPNEIASYNIYSATNGSTAWYSLTNTVTQSVIIADMPSGVYWLRATAVSTNGMESIPCAPVRVSIPNPPNSIRILVIK